MVLKKAPSCRSRSQRPCHCHLDTSRTLLDVLPRPPQFRCSFVSLSSRGEDGLIQSCLITEWFKLARNAGVLLHTLGSRTLPGLPMVVPGNVALAKSHQTPRALRSHSLRLLHLSSHWKHNLWAHLGPPWPCTGGGSPGLKASSISGLSTCRQPVCEDPAWPRQPPRAASQFTCRSQRHQPQPSHNMAYLVSRQRQKRNLSASTSSFEHVPGARGWDRGPPAGQGLLTWKL